MSIKHKTAGMSAALAVAVSTAWWAPQVSADSKYFPGTMCRLYGSTAGNDLALEPQAGGGTAIKNISNTTQYVMCPQIRDVPSGNLNYAQVIGQGNLVCSLYTRGWDGTGFTLYEADGTTDLPGDAVRISFFGGAAVGESNGGDMWGMWCVLPAGAMLVSYEFNEAGEQ
jgi:hypothetical protein